MASNFNTSQFHNTTYAQPAAPHPRFPIDPGIVDIIGTPAQPPAGSMRYVFTQNYNAERPKPGPGEATTMQYVAPKKFAKGDIVLGIKLPNGKIITVGQGPYDITDAVIEWKIGGGTKPNFGQPNNSISGYKQYLTPKNILIGGLAMACIILIARRRS